MSASGIPYNETGYFSSFMTDYLAQHPKLGFTYGRFPTLENLKVQGLERASSFSKTQRKDLIAVLETQYKGLSLPPEVSGNLKKLAHDNAVTLTTGHQLCLMTGPLFFVYKIITILKLAKELEAYAPELKVVPVYWMATEDHDFEEISVFQFQNQVFQWKKESKGPVGHLPLEDLEPVLKAYKAALGKTLYAKELQQLIAESYESATTLAEATRILVNALFGSYGLVILDADHPQLKAQFSPYIKKELTTESTHTQVNAQVAKIKKEYNANYRPQVEAREINLFYFHQGERYRIEKKEASFELVDSSVVFSEAEILAQLEAHPENFSPNVMMRPLYQEVILPNIAYVGGGGELAYWLQLKALFEHAEVAFPILLLRNAALVLTPKDQNKMASLGVTAQDLFLKRTLLLEKKTKALSTLNIDLQFFKTALEEQFKQLEALALQTDGSFKGSVAAQRAKQFKGIDRLEKRLLQAEKRKHKDQLERLAQLQERLFPQGQLQERVLNFSSFYCDHGTAFISQLYRDLNPLGTEFALVTTSE